MRALMGGIVIFSWEDEALDVAEYKGLGIREKGGREHMALYIEHESWIHYITLHTFQSPKCTAFVFASALPSQDHKVDMLFQWRK